MISCLVTEHDLGVVALAATMCIVGSIVTTDLFRRALSARGLQRAAWQFLVAVCAGSSTWATHFIAMLAYEPSAPVRFDPVLTLASVLIAIVGTGVGFAIASRPGRLLPIVLGGGFVGLSIAAMHFVGMFAYRVEGIVSWDMTHVFAAIAVSVMLSMTFVGTARRGGEGRSRHAAAVPLVAAIVGLHFTGMAAFRVAPFPGLEGGADAGTLVAMALAILLVGLVVVGAGISSYLIDDRTRASTEEQLRRMAFQDPLTGLANRRALQLVMEEWSTSEPWFALILMDLDHFKMVNDTHGHVVGDALLVAAARRMEHVVGADGVAVRIGGDEMAVVIRGDMASAETLALDLCRALAVPFEVAGGIVSVAASLGICSRSDAADSEGIMRHADLALYEAKRNGGGRVVPFEVRMLDETIARHTLHADLRAAVALNQFHLVFQPIVDLTTRRTIGHEALIRWQHPTRGLVSPAEFIPAAEDDGSIVEIGSWVLAEACRAAMFWPGDVYVAVNVSAVQFRSPLLLAHVTRALADSGLPPTRLEIELTETAAVVDAIGLAAMLKSLRCLGIKIAMDDFGTGFSSLSHLRDLSLDRIKIDRSFVASAANDTTSMAVLRAVIGLGQDMGIRTLGEGVETADQLELLAALGCDAVQGYLTGRPERQRRDADDLLQIAS
ncbi:MAG: EAL domain-containing protein [Rhizobiaceae bacterium]|nr:EAL domain-containing protein [Rhizobiaceae bacterium]